jgi:hypothetical protein
VLDHVGGVEISVQFEHHQHGRGKIATLGDRLRGGRDIGFSTFAQPDGIGIDTVKSVSLSGATGSPVTPLLSRYCENGTGASVDVVVVFGEVQIDW